MEPTDFVNLVDRFQQSQTVITSKHTESGGGLNLAIKRAKPNIAGPRSIPGSKTQEEVVLKKSEKKLKNKKRGDLSETLIKQTASSANPDRHEKSISTLDTPNKDVESSSTPKNKQKAKWKKIYSTTRPEDFLDTFQNQNLAPAEWENLADQLLKRGVQKVADNLRGHNQPAAEWDDRFEPPERGSDEPSVEDTGVRRNSRQIKSKEPKHLGTR